MVAAGTEPDVKNTGVPAHTVVVGITVTVPVCITVTDVVAETVQPCAVLPLTVYVPAVLVLEFGMVKEPSAVTELIGGPVQV